MTDEPIHPLHQGPDDDRGGRGGRSRGSSSGKDKAAPKRGKSAKKTSGVRAGKPARAGAKRRSRSSRTDAGPPPGTVRIQKVLAEAGIASRRACEEMVQEGRVRLNGKVVRDLPCFVRPGQDDLRVDGERVGSVGEEKVYVLLNKPKGVVCTNSDPEGRPRAIDLVPGVKQRVYPVGRLDTESTGLILLTNDGEFANRIAHPRYEVVKTYVVEVDAKVEGDAIEQLKKGLYLDGRKTAGAAVKVLRRNVSRTLLEVRLREGRNREIRRMLARLGYKVRSLRRVAIGPVTDRGIKTGKYRLLSPAEVRTLLKAATQE